MKIKTGNLNKAGFYYSFGAKLLGIEGRYPRNDYIMDVNPLTYWYEKNIGLIGYRRYYRFRYLLKMKAASRSGCQIPYADNR